MKWDEATALPDAALLVETMRLAASERTATAALLVHLGELDRRRLYLAEGFPSLFAYCREVLRLSESATFNRTVAARIARRFPLVLAMLEDGRANLTTIRLLAPHLTEDNHAELLDEAACKSKREVQEIAARLAPQADISDLVRRMPTHAGAPSPTKAVGAEAAPGSSSGGRPQVALGGAPEGDAGASSSVRDAGSAESAVEADIRHRETSVINPGLVMMEREPAPIAPGRYVVRFTATAATCEKLQAARALLGHAVPSGSLAEIFDRALTALLAAEGRRKNGAVHRVSPTAPSARVGQGQGQGPRESRPTSRAIPAAVRRHVFARDGGRCAFVSAGGRRCGATRRLEFHHAKPYAAGGEATTGNIELRCRPHNRHEADVYFAASRTARTAFDWERADRPHHHPAPRRAEAVPEQRAPVY